jgi:hypothetical protein
MQLESIQKYPTFIEVTALVTELKLVGTEGDVYEMSLHAAMTDETTCTGSEYQRDFHPSYCYAP